MSDEVTCWLAQTASPLNGLTAGASTADLQPLKGVLDGVRIAGLGEATHGRASSSGSSTACWSFW